MTKKKTKKLPKYVRQRSWGGHSNREVAARYGDGNSLEILKKWLSKTWG